MGGSAPSVNLSPWAKLSKRFDGRRAAMGVSAPPTRKDANDNAKKAQKNDREIIRVLKEIERKPSPAPAEKSGVLGGLASLIPGLGALGGLGGLLGGKGGRLPIGGLPGAPGATGPAGTAGGKLAGAAGKAGASGRIGAVLKRVPWLGAALGAYGVYSAATEPDDPNVTPEQQREQKAGAVGGAVGGLAGGLAGAAAGGTAGAVLGPPGAAVGALAGGIAGAMGGDAIGEKIAQAVSKGMEKYGVSEKISQATETARTATQEALAKIKSLAEDGKKALGDVAEKAGALKDEAIEALPQSVKDIADSAKETALSVVDKTSAAVEGISSLAKDAASVAVEKASSVASDVASSAKEFAAIATEKAVAAKEAVVAATPEPVKEVVTSVARTARRVGKAAKGKALALSDSLIESAPEHLKPVVTRAAEMFGRPKDANKLRAAANAAQWSQGDISGLNDAQTKALVASTLETESGGGRLDVVNEGGYMGKYQAGASWLAQAGMIRGGSEAVKKAKAADGFGKKSDWAWGKSGGMTKFLSSDENWVDGMSRQKYLSSHESQDLAFKKANEATFQALVKSGAITKNTPPDQVAGLLKAAHVAGIGGAKAVAAGGNGASDANGTSARKYFNDAADDKSGYRTLFSSANTPVAAQTSPSATAPAGTAQSSPAIAAQPATAATSSPSGVAVRQMAPITAARTQTATVSVPKAPVVSPAWTAPSLPEQPKVEAPPAPINTESSDRPFAGQRTPISQDLPDRQLAHIVTGGFGAPMR